MGKSKNRRGWSLVFDDQTSPTASEGDEGLDQKTVIDDGSLGAELAAALEDPRLKNVAITTPPSPTQDLVERTVRAPAPQFSSTSVGGEHLETDPPVPLSGPGMVLQAPPLPVDNESTAPHRQADLGSLMMTRPDTYEEQSLPDRLLEEGTLPPGGLPSVLAPPDSRPSWDEPVLVRATPNVGTRAVPDPARHKFTEEVEKTDLDIAAALGMAPLPANNAPMPVLAPPPPPNNEPKLADVLREVAEEKKGKKKSVGAYREGAQAEDLQRAAATSDSLARIIPVILMVFLLLGAIAVSVRMLRSGEGRNQTHVELRILPIGKGSGPVLRPSEQLTRLNIDTAPPGLLVLYKGEVLGRTPFSVDLPIELLGPAAAEVSSPYYEPWVGEWVPEAKGEFKILATLRPR